MSCPARNNNNNNHDGQAISLRDLHSTRSIGFLGFVLPTYFVRDRKERMYSYLKERYQERRLATAPALPLSLHRARYDDANKNTLATAIRRLGPREQLCWIYRIFFDIQRQVHHSRNGLCLANYPCETFVSSFQTPNGRLLIRLPRPAEIQQQCPQAVGHVLR